MYENILNDFDETGLLDPQNTVVRCETQEEADIFLEYLNVKGVWDKSQVKTLKERWSNYENETCYHFSKPSWCYASYYATESYYDIVDFCDIYKAAQESDITDIAYGYDQLFS